MKYKNCPSCLAVFENKVNKTHFCPACGLALDEFAYNIVRSRRLRIEYEGYLNLKRFTKDKKKKKLMAALAKNTLIRRLQCIKVK